MSKQSLKRWLAARDAYLGHQFPFIQERSEHYHRLRRRRRSRPDHHDQQTSTSMRNEARIIDYDETISITTMESEQFSIRQSQSRERPCKSGGQDSFTQTISHSETSLRRPGCFERIKSFVQSPVRSLSRLSSRLRTARQEEEDKRTQIIHDHFDDKCVGTEISEQSPPRTNVQRHDQSVQVDIARPQIELHHEYDPSMVEGERGERIRSARRAVECSDKTTETDFILNFANVKEEKRAEKESDDKATCTSRAEVDSHIAQPNSQHQSMSLFNSTQPTTTADPSIPLPKSASPRNRIVPLTDLLQTSMSNSREKTDFHHGSRSSILSPTESNLSVHEQLQRLRVRFNRLSKERRRLTCLLILFAIIMCGLLIGIFILSWAFQGRTPIVYRDVNATRFGPTDEASRQEQHDRQQVHSITVLQTSMSSSFVRTTLSTTTLPLTTSTKKPLARYGESCDHDSDCDRPFVCQRKGSSNTPGMCRCPWKYDFVKDQCVGDLNAVCAKDTDCQRFMLCSGTEDGTRRCQCQTQFNYDEEKKRCRGDHRAPCDSSVDCRANLICNRTASPSFCSCEFHYRYHPSLRKCRGDPGAVCDRATAECVDNAECRDGACECSQQFIPDENRVCVDPCPLKGLNPPRIRYPGNCRRFIDCQQKSKTECPEMTIFNLRTQFCDYPENVLDC